MKFSKLFAWMIAVNLFASVMGASALADPATGQTSSTACTGVSDNAGSGTTPAPTSTPTSGPSSTAINGGG